MKKLALCAGLLCVVAANAESSARATLTGSHMNPSALGAPLLICTYSGVHAKFEILSQNGTCAPYLDVR